MILKIKIDTLKENTFVKQKLSQYLNLLTNLINLLKYKMYHKNRDKYYEFSKNLYTHGALDLESIKDINNTYNNSKNIDNKSKEKDDYKL